MLHQARVDTRLLAVGVDACRENLREPSRTAPQNALFAIANALGLPSELDGLAQRVTLNFPWGSLLAGLLCGDPGLLDGLLRIARPGASFEIRLNASALAQAGWGLVEAGEQVRSTLSNAGLRVWAPYLLDAVELRKVPTSWARKMAFGRDPEAVLIQAKNNLC